MSASMRVARAIVLLQSPVWEYGSVVGGGAGSMAAAYLARMAESTSLRLGAFSLSVGGVICIFLVLTVGRVPKAKLWALSTLLDGAAPAQGQSLEIAVLPPYRFLSLLVFAFLPLLLWGGHSDVLLAPSIAVTVTAFLVLMDVIRPSVITISCSEELSGALPVHGEKGAALRATRFRINSRDGSITGEDAQGAAGWTIQLANLRAPSRAVEWLGGLETRVRLE